jgi:hypothetical protein
MIEVTKFKLYPNKETEMPRDYNSAWNIGIW